MKKLLSAALLLFVFSLPVWGQGTAHGRVSVNDLLTFLESPGDATCAAGDYWLKGNSTTSTIRGCEDGNLFEVNTAAGSAAWDTLTNPTSATTFLSDAIAEIMSYDFQANYTTEQLVLMKTSVGTPSGGTLLTLEVHDTDVLPFAISDGTNTVFQVERDGDTIIRNFADQTVLLRLDSGLTTAQTVAVELADQGIVKWAFIKDSSNNFRFSETGVSERLFFNATSHSVYRSGSVTTDHIFQDSGATERGRVLGDADTYCYGSGETACSSKTTDPNSVVGVTVTAGSVFGLPVIAADPNTATWGTGQDGRMWFNSTGNVPKFWDGSAIQTFGGAAPVDSVFTRTGAVVATEGDYSLSLLSDVDSTTGSGAVSVLGTNPTLTDVTVDDLITFTETAGDATCAAGDFNIKGNSSTNKLRGCENGTLFDLNTAGGAGDITDVGPGCNTGACWTDGLVTTGTVLLVWEGTGDDANEFTINVPANPGADIGWTIPDSATALTFPSGTTTVAAYSDVLSVFAPTTSAQFLGVISNETGTTGLVVASINPTLTDVTVDDLLTFTETAGDATCAAGDYWWKGNSTSNLIRGCENGVLFTPSAGGGAPTGATYITQTSDPTLSAEQALDALASGIMRVDAAAGVITSLTNSVGLRSNLDDEVGNDGGMLSAALTSPVVGDVICVDGISPTSLGNCSPFMFVANEGVTGTTINHFVKLTGAPSTAIITSSGDTTGIIGVCVAGCGTTGNAEIQVTGIVQVDFDGATTAGNYVENSNSVNGEGTDVGSSYPTTEQVMGLVTQTIGAAGLANVLLFPGESRDTGGAVRWDQLADPTGAVAMNSGAVTELLQFNYTAAYGATDVLFQIEQLTGNPVAGSILLELVAADTDILLLSAGSGANTIDITQAGAMSAQGTASITATLGDSATSFFAAGELEIVRGGTGQSTANAAMNALSPVTTEGDIIFRNATVNARLARGANGECLTASATTILWGSCGGVIRWDQLTDPTAVTIFNSGAVAELFQMNFTAAYGATDVLVDLEQLTGNPVAGSVLLGLTAADADILLLSADGFTIDSAGAASGPSFTGTGSNGNVEFPNSAAANAPVNTARLRYESATQRLRASFNAVAYSDIALASDNLSLFAATTSAQLFGVLSDETGTGLAVFDDDPLFSNQVRFTAIAAPAYVAGQLFYDSGEEALGFHNNEADITLQIGQEMWVRVRNESGSTITNGQVVYIDGLASGLPRVALARADVAATSEAIGIATHDIETASTGFVTAFGLVRDFDTSAFTIADRVFLSASTAGALTNTAPSDPNFVVPIGIVTEVNVTTGDVFVTLAPPRPTGGAGIQITGNTVSTLSSEENFLVSGVLSCGANTAGRVQTHTTPLQYCDNAGVPALQFAAYGASDGDALAGDSADSFFDAGTVEVDRGGTNLASGTDGGILGYTATGTLASSALLTANALVLGGGAGATPSTPVGLGTTTTLLHGNVAGAPSYGAVVDADISANTIQPSSVTAALDTRMISYNVIDPTTTESAKLQHKFGVAVTISRVTCSTDTGTATIDLDHRLETTPNTAGTDVLTGTIICDTDMQVDGGFADATIPADRPLALLITGVASTPGVVRVHVDYTVDDI